MSFTAKIVNGDTVRDANGDVEEADDELSERVAFYLGTRNGSFFGSKQIGGSVHRVQVLNSASIVSIRDEVKRALRPLLDSGEIENLKITPEPFARNGTAVNYYTVSYTPTGIVRR
jgi:hypothetical protein